MDMGSAGSGAASLVGMRELGCRTTGPSRLGQRGSWRCHRGVALRSRRRGDKQKLSFISPMALLARILKHSLPDTFNVPDMTAPNHPSVAQAEKQIPEIIKNLDGKTARIRGFMMPVKEAQGKTTEFLITRSQPSCCFSGAAEITEFVTVKVAGKGFDTMLDDPITIQGTLHVSAILDSGYIVGLYELDADKVVAPGS